MQDHSFSFEVGATPREIWTLFWGRHNRVVEHGDVRIEYLHWGDETGVAVSPDGNRLVSASADTTVKIWDAHRVQGPSRLVGHRFEVNRLAFSRDSRHLASAAGNINEPGGEVKVWEVGTGHDVLSLVVPVIPAGVSDIVRAGEHVRPRLRST